MESNVTGNAIHSYGDNSPSLL